MEPITKLSQRKKEKGKLSKYRDKIKFFNARFEAK